MRGRQRYDLTANPGQMRPGKNLPPAWPTRKVAEYFGINYKSLHSALVRDAEAPKPSSVVSNTRGRISHLWNEAARNRLAAWWLARQEAKP